MAMIFNAVIGKICRKDVCNEILNKIYKQKDPELNIKRDLFYSLLFNS